MGRIAGAQRKNDRDIIRVYETLPPQLLNAYGMSAFCRMGFPEAVYVPVLARPSGDSAQSGPVQERGIENSDPVLDTLFLKDFGPVLVFNTIGRYGRK